MSLSRSPLRFAQSLAGRCLILFFLYLTSLAEAGTLSNNSSCSNIPPPPNNFSCEAQAAWGKCHEDWMQAYCMLSCQRCPMEDPSMNLQCPGEPSQIPESPSTPHARTFDMPWMSVDEWCQRVKLKLQDPSRQRARLVFMGDSITEGWTNMAKDVWEEYFNQYQPLSLGIGGDQTQHLLWRLANGEVDHLQPELLVLLVGVNNIGYGGWSESATAEGIYAVLHELRQRLPATEILHLAIFPAGATPDDEFRVKIQKTNQLLQNLPVPGVSFLDIGPAFLNADNTISNDVMYDYLHPTIEGYRRWAMALEEEIGLRLKQ